MRGVVVAVLVVAMWAGAPSGGPAPASGVDEPVRVVPGEGVTRPRTAFAPGSETDLAQRVLREPYRGIFSDAHHLHEARRLSRTPGDPDRLAQKDMARSARWFAFEVAIDRTVIDGEVVAFPSSEARSERADIVEELLMGAYERNRLAVPPPLGNWDRDIDSAGELLQWSGALDILLSAGHDFEGNDQVIADRLIELAAELYRNYTRPETANGFADLHQNNHRSKSGAALATAAAVLVDYAPEPGDDPDASRDPLAWWDHGVTLVDDVLRYVLVAPDGVYAEGPTYYRFTTESIAPYVHMWERLLGAGSWTTAEGRVVPALHHTPQYAHSQDWMVAMTLPNGTLAPIDDANTREPQHFGALPALPNSDVYAWRWANGDKPYAQEGSTDLALDSIVAFDDSLVARQPDGSPTTFWPEGGHIAFRSGWDADDTVVLAQGEGITASEFGRGSDGLGRAPQSHEHMEPGSFLMQAEGTVLVLDPGYLSFGEHQRVLEARDHNMVLVDGVGPAAMLANSLAWRGDLDGPPPQDGFATVHSTLDTDRLDRAVVTTRYGAIAGGSDVHLRREFLFVDNRFLVILDEITPPDGQPVALDWVLHGNGGGTSGGTYTPQAGGGTWAQPAAGVSSAVVSDGGDLSFAQVIEEHESPRERRVELTHTAQYASLAAAGPTRTAQVVMPYSTADAPPEIAVERDGDRIAIRWTDPGTDRTGSVTWNENGVVLEEAGRDGSLPVAYTDGGTLTVDEAGYRAPGAAGLVVADRGDGSVEVGVDDPANGVYVDGVTSRRLEADGACAVTVRGGQASVEPGTGDRFVLRPGAGGSGPAAVVGPPYRRAEVGESVTLDASDSCGRGLTHEWELMAAPRGSNWTLDPEGETARLAVDATGPYRVRLTVVDRTGRRSDPVDVVVAGGDRCGDERDDDLDGLFDAADPDCDGPEPTRPVDVLGFITADGYIGSIEGSNAAAEVRRTIDGSPRSVRIELVDGDRRMAVRVTADADGTAVGHLSLTDPVADVRLTPRWSGRLIEPLPGMLVGLDDAGSTYWIAIDAPAHG